MKDKKVVYTHAAPYSEEGIITGSIDNEVFGDEAHHDIKYRTLSWPMVAVLMIAEIVSNGMLSLPSSGGVVGLVPNVILIVVGDFDISRASFIA